MQSRPLQESLDHYSQTAQNNARALENSFSQQSCTIVAAHNSNKTVIDTTPGSSSSTLAYNPFENRTYNKFIESAGAPATTPPQPRPVPVQHEAPSIAPRQAKQTLFEDEEDSQLAKMRAMILDTQKEIDQMNASGTAAPSGTQHKQPFSSQVRFEQPPVYESSEASMYTPAAHHGQVGPFIHPASSFNPFTNGNAAASSTSMSKYMMGEASPQDYHYAREHPGSSFQVTSVHPSYPAPAYQPYPNVPSSFSNFDQPVVHYANKENAGFNYMQPG